MSRLKLILKRLMRPTRPRPNRIEEELSINLEILFGSTLERKGSPRGEKVS